jgi:hypothetical protein
MNGEAAEIRHLCSHIPIFLPVLLVRKGSDPGPGE